MQLVAILFVELRWLQGVRRFSRAKRDSQQWNEYVIVVEMHDEGVFCVIERVLVIQLPAFNASSIGGRQTHSFS